MQAAQRTLKQEQIDKAYGIIRSRRSGVNMVHVHADSSPLVNAVERKLESSFGNGSKIGPVAATQRPTDEEKENQLVQELFELSSDLLPDTDEPERQNRAKSKEDEAEDRLVSEMLSLSQNPLEEGGTDHE